MGVWKTMETLKILLQVERHDINYLRTTLESYDGMSVVRTVDPMEARIEVMISPGCENFVFDLLDSLRQQEGLLINRL